LFPLFLPSELFAIFRSFSSAASYGNKGLKTEGRLEGRQGKKKQRRKKSKKLSTWASEELSFSSFIVRSTSDISSHS
jgi:hypothetical protein